MIDPAKPSPESGTSVELPAEIMAAMDAVERASRGVGANAGSPLVKHDVAEASVARAALVAAIVKYGDWCRTEYIRNAWNDA